MRIAAGTRRFGSDVLWNAGSLVVLGLSGIAANAIIAATSGAAALGVFNQVFAFYIFLSQLAVGGVHLSVLKHVSHCRTDAARCEVIAKTALVLAAAIAIPVALVTVLAREPVGRLLDSPGIATGLGLIAPGLVAFSLNKVLLNVLNGLARMRAFAIFQATRFLAILAALALLVGLGAPASWLAISLTIAELTLLLALTLYFQAAVFSWHRLGVTVHWLREHLSFGGRGFVSGALAEVNTRVDILMLGYFMDDAVVGIYSFAAVIAEGLNQLPVAIRRVVDPIVGERFAAGDVAGLEARAARVRNVAGAAMLGVGIVAVLLYPLVLPLLADAESFGASTPVFTILIAGVLVSGPFRPFGGVILQGGRPGTHTLLVGALVAANVAGNVLLIPVLGIVGAATATALAFVLEAVLIVVAADRLFGVRLWRLR